MMAKFQRRALAYSCVENPLMPPEGEVKKHPDMHFAARLVSHIFECSNPQCRKIWNTEWGSYIGQEPVEGQLFHFTNCALGRALNEELGWKYDDPRH